MIFGEWFVIATANINEEVVARASNQLQKRRKNNF
jgi:hypothetical protein